MYAIPSVWLLTCVNYVVLWNWNLKDSRDSTFFFPSRFRFYDSSQLLSSFWEELMFSHLYRSEPNLVNKTFSTSHLQKKYLELGGSCWWKGELSMSSVWASFLKNRSTNFDSLSQQPKTLSRGFSLQIRNNLYLISLRIFLGFTEDAYFTRARAEFSGQEFFVLEAPPMFRSPVLLWRNFSLKALEPTSVDDPKSYRKNIRKMGRAVVYLKHSYFVLRPIIQFRIT